MPDSSDRYDVEQSLRGDHDAFERIVGRYQADVAGRMWRFCRDHGVCEGLVQEVFVEAYYSLPSYRGQAPLLHWLRRIATRVGYRWLREQYRHRREQNEAEVVRAAAHQESQVDTVERVDWVHTMLARLKPRDRLVLTLLYLEECSVEEAADRTGWSISMVKVQAHRARKRLKRVLQENETKAAAANGTKRSAGDFLISERLSQ